MCRSRRELSNAYLLANFGLDTAENEPCRAEYRGRVDGGIDALVILNERPGGARGAGLPRGPERARRERPHAADVRARVRGTGLQVTLDHG